MIRKIISVRLKKTGEPKDVSVIKEILTTKLGVAFQKNYHHGLKHSDDLFELAKELVKKSGSNVDWEVLSAAILLHDIFAHNSKTHGKLACNYFAKNFSSYFTQQQSNKIKEAILLHDNKSGKKMDKTSNTESKILYDIDNMDAFGIKGIYRYIAIYSMRGDDLKTIPANIKNRYESLNFNESKAIIEKEYRRITTFFNNQHTRENKKIISFIEQNKKLSPIEIANKALAIYKQEKEPSIFHFFETLLKEYR